jgi:hypothetical protein
MESARNECSGRHMKRKLRGGNLEDFFNPFKKNSFGCAANHP